MSFFVNRLSASPPARAVNLFTAHAFLSEFKLYAPVAVLYFETVTGSFTAAMAIVAAGILASTVLEVPTGMLSDRIGRKATMIMGAISFCLYVLFMALAQDGPTLLLATLMAGLSDALVSGNNNALLYESLDPADRPTSYPRALARAGSAMQIALGVSAIGGGLVLLAGGDYRLLVWLSLLPQILRVILCFFVTNPPREPSQHNNIFTGLRDAVRLFVTIPRLRLMTVAGALQFGIGEAAHRFIPAFYQTVWPVWAISALSILRNFLSALGFRLAGRIIRKFGDVRVLFVSASLMTLSGLAAGIIQNVFSPFLMYMNSLFYPPGAVAREHLLQQDFTDDQRATMGSLAEFCASLVTALMAVLLGWLADTINPATAFLTAMILRLPVIGLYWRLFRHEKQIHDKQS